MSNSRARMVAIAGGLTLSLSLAATPLALAQDGPEATIEGLMAAIEAKDFEALPSFFCEEFAGAAASLDLTALAEGLPPEIDVTSLIDAFVLDTELASVEVVSQTDTEAVVHVEGSLAMSVDIEALTPFIEAMLAAMEFEVTPENIEMFSAGLAGEFAAETTVISEDITLVPGEEMAWLVCDDLGTAIDEPVASEEPVEPVASEEPATTE